MDDLTRALGQRLRAQRKLRGVTQVDLAEAAGLSRSSVANIELGNQTIQLGALVTAAKFLGIPVAMLLDEKEVPALPRVLVASACTVTCENCGQIGVDLGASEAVRVRREHLRWHLPAQPAEETT